MIVMKPVVELKNVSKKYKMDDVEVQALYNINLKIKSEEFVSIIGPSGSGKSTMLHIMGCLDRPTTGYVFIDGINTSELSDNELAKIRGSKIGFVFQTFNLINRLTALENVMLPMWFNNVPKEQRKKRAQQLLKEVGLEKRMLHTPNQLSGGERQRVAIARALANDPAIILADEPTGNLDTKSGKEILKIFEKLNKRGRTIVIITHDLNIARVSEKIIHIMDGRLVS